MTKIFFIIIISTIILLLFLAVFGTFKITKNHKKLRALLITFIITGFLCFLISMLFGGSSPKWLLKITQQMGFSWLISIPLYLISLLLTLIITKFSPKESKIGQYSFWFFLFAIVTFLVIGNYNYRDIKTVNYKFYTDGYVGNNVRIVLASDFHLGNYIDKNDLERFIKKINIQKPDIVILAGDVMDRDLAPLQKQNMDKVFSKINAPVYAVLGNHEYYGNQKIIDIKEFYKEAKIHLLVDSVAIDNNVVLLGRDDTHNNSKRKTVQELYLNAVNDSLNLPVVIISHQPMEYSDKEDVKINNALTLYLSGHTHNGQLYPFSKIVRDRYPHFYGHFNQNNVDFITTSGIGLWGPKIRFGTQSEIVVIDLLGETNYKMPARDTAAINGTQLVSKIEKLDLIEREKIIVQEILNGNIPQFLRTFKTISFTNDTNYVEMEILSDYLSVGSNEDFIRIPITPIAAQIIADSLNCVMPTSYLVDIIASCADGALEPFPFRPSGNRNELLITFQDSNNAINALLEAKDYTKNLLISGLKKDIIVTKKIAGDSTRPNHVTIYGWHYPNGKRIQPSNNVHSNDYVDYSHGVRLIKRNIMINGKYFDIESVLQDSAMFHILSNEDSPMIKASYRGDSLHTKPIKSNL